MHMYVNTYLIHRYSFAHPCPHLPMHWNTHKSIWMHAIMYMIMIFSLYIFWHAHSQMYNWIHIHSQWYLHSNLVVHRDTFTYVHTKTRKVTSTNIYLQIPFLHMDMLTDENIWRYKNTPICSVAAWKVKVSMEHGWIEKFAGKTCYSNRLGWCRLFSLYLSTT